MQSRTRSAGVSRARSLAPEDVESVDRLVHGGLILGALALGDLVDRRFRWLAYGAAGALAASAFTGWTPATRLLELAGVKSRAALEHEKHGLSTEESSACSRDELEVFKPVAGGRESDDVGTSSRGVPHRIPLEAFTHHDAVDPGDRQPELDD